MKPRDRLARLHCVNTLFQALTGHDLYLAQQVLGAIDAASAEADRAPGRDLAATLSALHQQLFGTSPEAGFAFCDGATDASAGPLFLRAQVLAAVRRNAPRSRATILIGNLPADGRRTRATRRGFAASPEPELERADLVAQLRELVARRANPRSALTLLFV
ncbi:MAG TPA: hypothetical protein VGA56_00575 [Opitutaceae bacterium]